MVEKSRVKYTTKKEAHKDTYMDSIRCKSGGKQSSSVKLQLETKKHRTMPDDAYR